MPKHSRFSFPLLMALLAPFPLAADLIDVSPLELTAFSSVSSQRVPEVTAFDRQFGAKDSQALAETLLRANGQTFPNIPTSQTTAFSNAATAANGFFAVGVNGHFLQNSLPPNALVASGTSTGTITNNSAFNISMDVDFFVPSPTLQFFGQVGNFFPAGANPALDVSAAANIRLVTALTHADGSTVDTIHLDYGLQLVRLPISGVLTAVPTRDGTGLTRFEEPDGSFGFQLPELDVSSLSLGNIGPGDTLKFSYEYFAQAATGFGEVAVLAAIGDPFNLNLSGGRFNFQVRDVTTPAIVPEPSTLAMLGVGLLLLGHLRRRPTTR